MTVTSCPVDNASRAKFDPMKPAPPVMSTRTTESPTLVDGQNKPDTA
jgi:hypothetical protein